VPRAAWHWGGKGSVANDPLGAKGSTPLYLCLPHVWGSAGGDRYFPITRGTQMETTNIKDKKSTKCRDSVVQKHLLKFAQQGASQSGEPPQGPGSSSKPRDTEYLITPQAGPSGLTE
jgi:hypothetical protein